MTDRRGRRSELLALEMSAGPIDEFGPTPDEIIRRITEGFAKDMAQIMGSTAVAQVGVKRQAKTRRAKAHADG